MGTLIGVPRPATGKTPIRNFRVSDAVYDPANRVAAARGESLTDVVEKALAAYYRRHRGEDPGPGADLPALRSAGRKRTARELMAVKPIERPRKATGKTARDLMSGGRPRKAAPTHDDPA